jgi:hypothetical protein
MRRPSVDLAWSMNFGGIRRHTIPAAQAAEETIAVSVNASSSVTFTETEKTAVLNVLNKWVTELGPAGTGSGPAELREALAE